MATYDPYSSSWGTLQNTQFDVSGSVPTYTMSGPAAPVSTPSLNFGNVASAAGSAAGAAAKANPYVAAGTMALGALETIIAARKLKKLDKQKPAGFQITPEEQEMYQRSKDMASYGFSQQQKDAYLGQMQQQSNVAFQRAKTAAGGSLAAALGATTSRKDMSQLALADAQLQAAKEARFGQAAMAVSRKRDVMAQQDISDYQRKQQAWGGALQSGLGQLASGFNLMSATSYKG